MRQKELRIALVCYGGISLAVYMHGVTKELWKLCCASRSFHAGDPHPEDSQGVYWRLLDHIGAAGAHLQDGEAALDKAVFAEAEQAV